MADKEPNEELEIESLKDAPESDELNFEPENENDWRDKYEQAPTWAKNIAKIVAGLIILLIIVLIGRTIHHHLKNNGDTAGKHPGTQQVAKAPTKQNGAKTSGGKTSGNNGSAGSATNGNSSSATKPTITPTTVPDTGPGSLVVLFVGTAAAAAVLHYGLSARRANR